MSFGKNPHVAKAQAAELKAQEARDAPARERAWREAAHLWERAAKQEVEGKRRAAYEDSAAKARQEAENPARPEDSDVGGLVVRMADVQARRPLK